MTGSLGYTIAVLIVLWLSGYPIARLLVPADRQQTAESLLRLGASLLLGCLLFSVLLYLRLAVGARWTVAYWVAVWSVHAGLALAAIVLLVRDRRYWIALWRNAAPSARIAVAATGAVLLSAAVVGGHLGLLGYDARAIYGLKAKVLAEQGMLTDVDFRDVHRLHFMPGYPLLVPILEAQVFRLSGNASDQGLPLLFWAFLTANVILWASYVARFDRTAAAWLTLFFALTPWLWKFSEGAGLSGSADVVLTAYLLAAAVCAARSTTEKGYRYALVCGLAIAGAMAVKQEGVLWCGLILTTLGLTWIVDWRRRRCAPARSAGESLLAEGIGTNVNVGRRWKSLTNFGIVTVTGLSMIVLLRMVHGDIPRSPLYRSYFQALSWDWLGHCVGRIPQIASFAVAECVNNVWGFGWGALFLSLMLKRNRPVSTEATFLRLLTTLGAASYLAVFLVTPYPLTYHLFTAFRRLMFHIYPVAMLVLAEQVMAAGIVGELGRVFRFGTLRTANEKPVSNNGVAQTLGPDPLEKAA
ncbi:hypothetical protein [Thermopirellula anaerolimosa]